ncbi:MAG: glycosyltransferase family 2 protein [Thermoguttaceae bacterium]|jgi:glycosyltransferase involved in cell wall biosynthesis|nr:glycosyltransferase family 2 protein [Thermoguttaceae bacterium]
MERLPVSVIIPVLNEEKNLPDCLASVSWADEVFVVDSHSTDATCRVALERGAKVVQFDFQPGGPRKKNWSLDNLPLRNEWVLLLDADERITPELQAEIERVFAEGPKHAGYYLNRKQVFLGRWLRHGGNYPSWNLRLLRRDAGRYEWLDTEELASAGDVEVHEHVVLKGTAGYLKEPMLHLDFKDLHRFIERHNNYSTWDAKVRLNFLAGKDLSSAIPARFFGSPVERKRWLKRLWVRLPCRPLLRFVYMYFVRLGFLDGRPGFIYAMFKAIQEFHINAKMFELREPSQAALGAHRRKLRESVCQSRHEAMRLACPEELSDAKEARP